MISLAIDYTERSLYYNGKTKVCTLGAKKELTSSNVYQRHAGQVFGKEQIY